MYLEAGPNQNQSKWIQIYSFAIHGTTKMEIFVFGASRDDLFLVLLSFSDEENVSFRTEFVWVGE